MPEEHITLGEYSSYNANLSPWRQKVVIGRYTQIAREVTVVPQHPSKTHPRVVSSYSFKPPYPTVSFLPVEIGNDVWIGHRAILFGGVKIGDGAIVGASALVNRDVPPFAVVYGTPARIARYRFNEEQIAELLRIRWWDWPLEKIHEILPQMSDIDVFLAWAKEEEAKQQ